MTDNEQVSALSAAALMREHGYVYLDVRTVAEFDTGHVSGAFNVPLVFSAPEGPRENVRFVAEVRAALGEHDKVIVGCASGVRSSRASLLLREAGLSNVVEQRSGMDGLRDAFGRVKEKGYRAEGLPIAFEPEPGHSHAELQRRCGD